MESKSVSVEINFILSAYMLIQNSVGSQSFAYGGRDQRIPDRSWLKLKIGAAFRMGSFLAVRKARECNSLLPEFFLV